jgi:hypothetical protein
MQEIIIDEEFRILLPTLDEETFRLLEESLLEHGCRDPLVLWNGILIDGYNRFRICTYHDIPFTTVDMEFDSREDVVIWIITNQISRRNLTPMQLSHFRGMHYKADRKKHGDISRVATNDLNAKNGANALNNASGQNDHLRKGSTASRLSEQYSVSPKTIRRNASLAAGLTSIGEISHDVKTKILNGEVRVGKSRLEALASATPEVMRQILHGEKRVGMNRLEALASATPKEVESVVREMKEGTFVSRAARGSSNVGDAALGVPHINSDSILPEIRQLNTVISDFAANFNSVLQELSSGDPAPLKHTLRSFINELEELYQNL